MLKITTEELTQTESLVFEIVTEYLNEQRTFDIRKIVPFIQARCRNNSININDVGIKKALKTLVKKHLLIEGSKLSRDMVLDNETRKDIYDYLLKNSAVYYQQIITDLNLNYTVVVWHLKMLKKFQFIQKETLDNRDVFFEINKDFNKIKVEYFASKEKSQQILSFLRENNIGITKTELAKQLDMHIHTIDKYLEILESINLIRKENIDNNQLYFLNQII